MSTDRGRKRTAGSVNERRASPRRPLVRLARGVRLDGGGKKGEFVLICADGKVQLNSGAARILGLCDGSRDRQGVITEVMRMSNRHTLAAEVREFLDAAQVRGWIVER